MPPFTRRRLHRQPARLTQADDDHADYVVKIVTDRHSLGVFDVDGRRLTMVQIDEAGREVDRITVTKEARATSQAGSRGVGESSPLDRRNSRICRSQF